MSELGKVIEAVEAARDDLAENCAAIKNNKGESLVAAYHPMAVEMFGLAVCPHIDTLIAAAKRAEQAEAEVGRLREVYKRCKVCERTVDTREQTDGGDPHGGQLESGEWVCSHECYEETLTPPPAANEGAHP